MGSDQAALDFRNYRTLMLNGEVLKGDEIVEYCSAGPAYIAALGNFAQEWLSPHPHIAVKTSGSTGTPKIMEVKKADMLYSASLTAQYFGFSPEMTAVLALPVQYIAGKMMVVRAFLSGLNLLCFEPKSDVLTRIGSSGADFAPLVPMQLQGQTHVPVRQVLLGGAPVSAALEQQVQNLAAEVYHGFGMTETLSHAALRRVNGRLASPYYEALPGVKLQLDERGCLCLKMPWMPDFIVTNDVADLISDSHFEWKGRADFVINSGGMKLFPEEIEKKIVGLQRRFFVWGVPDERLGQKAVLFVEGPPMELAKYFRNLSAVEIPKRVCFIPVFKETESGKINRLATVALAGNAS